MPQKNPGKRRAYYQANAAVFLARKQGRRKRNKRIVDDLRARTPCSDCGKLYPPHVMDFDHVNGDDKVNDVLNLALSPVSVEKLMIEIAKCEIVCSNCHRIRTHERRVDQTAFE